MSRELARGTLFRGGGGMQEAGGKNWSNTDAFLYVSEAWRMGPELRVD